MEMESTTHMVLISIPVFSHQVSILEFAKRFVDLHKHYSFHFTCIIPTIDNTTTPNSIFYDSLPSCIQCIFLPPVNFDDNNTVESQVHLAVSRSMPLVRQTLISLSNVNVVALIADAYAYQALHFAKEFNILCYTYSPCSAMTLSFCIYSSKLEVEQLVSSQYKDLPKPIDIPGCIPVEGIDLPDSVQDRSSLAYKLFLQRYQQLRLADGGIIVNSFKELEGGAIKAISEEQGPTTVYPIGPIIQTRPNSEAQGWECLQWLDNQQPNSVLYISFGSGGTLSQEQTNELALGLELSNHKFLWVNVRVPNNKATASYLSNDEVEDPINFLPSGFLQRTKGLQGYVMSGWAPQVEILKHNAIGAFLTHCGWNSILESIVHGVPMIAWPLFAEQRMNAAFVTDGLKVAVRPKCNNEGVVVKEEIGDHVKGLMEGLESEGIRWRMKELQKLAACAVMEDGSSTKTLCELALKWKSLGKPTE